MMYSRIKLLRELLAPDGFLITQIDDSEGHYLKVMLDEIFGRANYLTSFYIQVRYGQKTLSEDNDYQKVIEQLFVYAKDCSKSKVKREQEAYKLEKFEWKITEKSVGESCVLGGKKVMVFKHNQYEITKVNSSVEGLKETWATGSLVRQSGSSGEFLDKHLAPRKTIDGLKCLYKVDGIGEDGLGYRYMTGPKKMDATKGKFYSGVPLQTRDALTSGNAFKNTPVQNFYDFSGSFGNCKQEGGVDFGGGKKPETLLHLIFKHFSEKGDVVLDSFLGSGTTAAVAHKMGRRWIGIEMQDHAQSHCQRRLETVISGDPTGISKAVNWQGGGGFSFYTLGEPIFDALGRINPAIRFADLAAYVWQAETGQLTAPPNAQVAATQSIEQATAQATEPANPTLHKDAIPLLGIHQGRAYFLLYNGILKDRRPDAGNVLTPAVWVWLQSLLPAASQGQSLPCTVFGDSSLILAAQRERLNIEFKRMPYKLKKV